MFQQTVDKSQYPAALGFLVGGGKLNEVFNFELYKGDDMNFPGGQVLVGTPKTASPAYTKVLFYVDSSTKHESAIPKEIANASRSKRRFVS